MGFIGRSWRGEEQLWKVFWLYGVVLGFILNMLIEMALGKGMVGMAVHFPYVVWNMVSLWRCAWNAGGKFWGFIVRLLVIFGVIGYIMIAVMGAGLFALSTSSSGKALMMKSMQQAIPASPATPISPVSAPVVPTATAPAVVAPMGIPAAPVAPAPVAPAAAVPADAPAVPAPTNPCEQKMADYATANHTDPKAYIAANQAYLQQCMAAMAAPATPH